MQELDAVWELRVQLCRDLEVMRVEDAIVARDEAASQFVRVGQLHAQAQSS